MLPRGLAIGFAIAAPVGPIGVLVIRRTLVQGRLAGFISGAGAATADATYGALAAFGLTFISGTLIHNSALFRVAGGLFLLYLGIRILRSSPAQTAAGEDRQGLHGLYASTVLLTLSNPATILSFGVVFAGLGLASTHGSYASAALLVVGVFLGSLAWWLLLSGTLGLFRQRFSVEGLRWVNRVSGVVIMAFGAVALVTVVRSLIVS